ncbi:hypothetical protein NG895_07940 [Aeoliella sp. ICT_H6.2]|uniref:Type II/III secretion system protein n=1 Tax=Aeoliella straminimaris TaxID=2954799 RepID=A0A9X2FDG2_9BACT|nr:hypothetical protein [Aeoliella straminimaris]MCO6043836.1 hypothetical protein [Aeoliella straminimaris]
MLKHSFLLLVTCLVCPAMALAAEAKPEDSWEWLQQKLSMPTTLHVHKMPLNQVVELLEQQTGLQMIIDTTALDDLGLSPDEPVTVSLDSVTFGAMLDLAFKELELSWSLREKVVIITTEEEALIHQFVRVYQVDDLLQIADGYPDYDSVIDVIISTIASDTWVENGGPEAEIRPLPSSNALVISQTLQTHLQIEQLLIDIRRVRQRQGLAVTKSPMSSTRSAKPAAPRRIYYQPSSSAALPREYE